MTLAEYSPPRPHIMNTVSGDQFTVEHDVHGCGAISRERIVIAVRCVGKHLDRYVCSICLVPLANTHQLTEHTATGIHCLAQWCAECQRWEPLANVS